MLLGVLAIICILPIVQSASLGCYKDNITNTKLMCSYTPDKTEMLNPKIINTDGLIYTLNSKPISMVPNNFYNFTINYDLNKSKPGAHIITIVQNDKNVSVNLNQKTDLDYTKFQEISFDSSLDYSIAKQINVKLDLTNNTNKTKPVVLTATNIPSSISIDKKSQLVILQPNETKTIRLQVNYKTLDTNKIEYTISYSNKKQIIPINFDTNKMIITKTNSIAAFFTLANNNSNTIFILVDVILFIASIVLFTMFVGRLGKYIVKK